MKFLKNLFGNKKSEINHLKKLIKVQEEIVEVHENTMYLLAKSGANDILSNLISSELKETKDVLEAYKKDLEKLES